MRYQHPHTANNRGAEQGPPHGTAVVPDEARPLEQCQDALVDSNERGHNGSPREAYESIGSNERGRSERQGVRWARLHRTDDLPSELPVDARRQHPAEDSLDEVFKILDAKLGAHLERKYTPPQRRPEER